MHSEFNTGFIGGLVTGCITGFFVCVLPRCIRHVYNKCVKYNSVDSNTESKFTIKLNISPEEKLVLDKNGDNVCLICFDKLYEKNIIIECVSCSKYIGHSVCISKWLETNPTCPLCRS